MCMRSAKFFFTRKFFLFEETTLREFSWHSGEFEQSFAISENYENTSLFQQPLSLMQQLKKQSVLPAFSTNVSCFFFFLLGQWFVQNMRKTVNEGTREYDERANKDDGRVETRPEGRLLRSAEPIGGQNYQNEHVLLQGWVVYFFINTPSLPTLKLN
jgi:hypothetical protein